MVTGREIIETSRFRGLTADELRLRIEEACNMGAVVLMKQANRIDNLGKSPALVVAEMMILAQFTQEATSDDT